MVWLVKKHFSGTFSSSETENASETRFEMPKPDHANALNIEHFLLTPVYHIEKVALWVDLPHFTAI